MFNSEQSVLFIAPSSPEAVIWEGPQKRRDEFKEQCGVDEVRSRGQLKLYLEKFGPDPLLSLPSLDSGVNSEVESLLGRTPNIREDDYELARSVVEVRLTHDQDCLDELRRAALATVSAHRVGMEITRSGLYEYQVLAEMEAECARHGMNTAFPSVLSVRGEILHNTAHDGILADGDLLVADLGAETRGGFAGDITRTWPVSGRFTALQRDVYDLVLDAQRAAIESIRPGRRFREVHLRACERITEGLIDIGLLKGRLDQLMELGVYTLFFPHGIGHLLGLDAHDMEDLGDIAGYPEDRCRSEEFGLCYLRLDRDLKENMVVTVEPGFYSIRMLIEDAKRMEGLRDCLVMERLEAFQQVRGIRIEDEVLVTRDGREVLTAELPKTASEIEDIVGSRFR